MERLMKEEIEKKAENPQYKKKTKKQLAEELKPKSTIINLEKFRKKRLEKQRQEAQEWAAKREKVMKRRQKAAAKLKRKMISEQLQAEIQQLKEDGSYKIKDGV
ncbi:32901_t:CDS:2 [Racocetra persica]|uniref:32901_t:CDS:1 n=1 Tax=Racocetra persica TaxID=160502 RepID=A0ACA9PAF3_9GLOM|nr:32901_t:CDS:2 [Racocetra persica]